jgi:hypothetical protein
MEAPILCLPRFHEQETRTLEKRIGKIRDKLVKALAHATASTRPELGKQPLSR